MMKKTLFVIYTAVFFMMSVITNASAEQLLLPVSQVVSYERYENSTDNFVGNYTLKAMDQDAPMLAGTVNGIYEFSIAGSSTYVLPEIKTNTQGQWEYTITANNISSTQRDNVLYLTLYAVDKGENMELVFVARNSDGKKCDLVFYASVIKDNSESNSESTDVYSSEITSPGMMFALKTGYISNMIIYVIVMVLSMAVFILLKHRTDKY